MRVFAAYPSLSEIWAWITGSDLEYVDGLPTLVFQHLWLSVAALALACVVAVPLALLLAHYNIAPGVSINIANAFRAVPAFGLLLLAFVLVGFSQWVLVIVFAIIGVGPIFANTYIGVRGVDHATVDAAIGMGLTPLQQIRDVELPLASPVIMAGIRTAAVNIVATVTLAAYVGFGGLGLPIRTGLERGMQYSDTARFFALAGASAAAFLAIATEAGLGWLQRRLTPPSLNPATSADSTSPSL